MKQSKWYVLETYRGRELNVVERIRKLKKLENKESNYSFNQGNLEIEDIYVPVRKIASFDKKCRKHITKEVMLPGYVFIKCDPYKRIDGKETARMQFCNRIRAVDGVRGFLWNKGPTPLENTEIIDMLNENQMEFSAECGDQVEVIDGIYTAYKGEVIYIEDDIAIVKINRWGDEVEEKIQVDNLKVQ